jgi:hypothetical protein
MGGSLGVDGHADGTVLGVQLLEMAIAPPLIVDLLPHLRILLSQHPHLFLAPLTYFFEPANFTQAVLVIFLQGQMLILEVFFSFLLGFLGFFGVAQLEGGLVEPALIVTDDCPHLSEPLLLQAHLADHLHHPLLIILQLIQKQAIPLANLSLPGQSPSPFLLQNKNLLSRGVQVLVLGPAVLLELEQLGLD